MAKDGFMTAKAIGNRIKAKGLQKLRWYCQICEKQCRDENGFKCHCASESHQRKILLVAEAPEKYVSDYSAEFQRDFMKLLSSRYGTRRASANLVYQEFIADRTHLHMNATKWATLSEFVMHLGKEGLAAVDETAKGWFLTWVDNSPKALARQEAIAKKERMELDDEQREMKLLQEQIDKAEAAKKAKLLDEGREGTNAEESGSASSPAESTTTVGTDLIRENEAPIKLEIKVKLAGSTTLGAGPAFKAKSMNSLAAKKPNPFAKLTKAAPTAPVAGLVTLGATPGSSSNSNSTKKRTAVEEIIENELARKRRLLALSSSAPRS